MNRYLNARRNPDWTIDQDWRSYSDVEHDRWNRLFARQAALLPGRACDEFQHAMARLELSGGGVPDFAVLSERLSAITGWRVAPVAGLVPDEVFFEHLANRTFPAGAFIRTEAQFDYIQEPDVFHDVFGHVPLLANPDYARFLQAYGEGGRRAMGLGRLHNLARLYWYTVEFGLTQSPHGLRIFGAGILSSPGESIYALTSPAPRRLAFDLMRVMRTRYIISAFQQTYFVIQSFAQLLADCGQDFGPLYDRLCDAEDIEPHELAPGDRPVMFSQ